MTALHFLAGWGLLWTVFFIRGMIVAKKANKQGEVLGDREVGLITMSLFHMFMAGLLFLLLWSKFWLWFD